MSKRQYFLKERKDHLFSKLKGQKFPSTNNINTLKNMYTLKTHELLVRTSILEIIYITSDLFIWLQTSDRPGTVRVHHCKFKHTCPAYFIPLAFSVSIDDFKGLSNEQQPY